MPRRAPRGDAGKQASKGLLVCPPAKAPKAHPGGCPDCKNEAAPKKGPSCRNLAPDVEGGGAKAPHQGGLLVCHCQARPLARARA